MSQEKLSGYKVYALIHSSLIAFLAIMTLIIASDMKSKKPYPNTLATYWSGFSQLIISVIAFVSFFVVSLEIRLANIILHVIGAFVAAGGLIVVTVLDIGRIADFNKPPYDTVDCRPILLVIGGLMFLLDFIFVFVCGTSKNVVTKEFKREQDRKLERVLDMNDFEDIRF